MAVKIQFRRDTQNNWTNNDPILLPGELAWDTTDNSFKIGDGISRWTTIDVVSADWDTVLNLPPTFVPTTENVQDIVGAMISGNTEAGIAVTYDDATGKLNFNVGDPSLSVSGDATATATMTDLGNTNLALTLANTAVTAGSYGGASDVPVITVDSKGRITAATTTAVAGVDNVAYDQDTGVLTIDTSDGTTHTVDIDVGDDDSPEFAAITVAGNITIAGTVDGRDIALDESNATTDRALIRTEMATNETDRDTSEAAAISTAINNLVDASPGTLDTLNELALAIGDDANHVTTMTNLITAETTRATTAESTIQSDVNQNESDSDASHTAATTDRALIRTEMATNETDRDTSEAAAIAVETSRASAAEAAIQSDVNANELASDNSHTAATTDRALIRTEVVANENARDTSEAAAISTAINALVDSAPGTLDTLNELAAAIGDDANHLTTMTSLISSNETARDVSIAAQEVLNATARTNIQADVNANELASDNSHAAATTDRALIRTEMAGNESARDTSVTNSLALKVNKAGDTITGNLDLADNVKATFGNSNDLQIYHNSTDNSSYITEWGTGNLKIMGNNVYLQNSSGANYVTGVSGGQTALYHNGTNRMITTSIGINVLGDIALSGLVDTRNVASDGAAQDSHIANTSNPHSVTKAQVGLSNVTNESKTTMFTSAALTSTPTAPTAASNTNSTQIATTAYVQTELTDLIGGAPGTLDTLNELAAAINDDASYASTLTTSLGTKVAKAGSTMSGNLGFSDGVKAMFGNSNDLEIHHDGTHSYIHDAGTGDLHITSNNAICLRKHNNELMLQANTDGALNLYYDNAIKLATTAAGINVTGNIVVSGTVDGRDVATDGTKLDSIATSSNNYSHPITAGNKHIPTGGSVGQILKNTASGTATWQADNNTTYTVGDGGLTQKNFTSTLKTKLDGIETGATADQTAAQILTAIKTVDGSGSGLDADMIDGYGSGSFLRSDANDTGSSILTLSGGSAPHRLVIHNTTNAAGAGINFTDTSTLDSQSGQLTFWHSDSSW
jgi:hypothetical protein